MGVISVVNKGEEGRREKIKSKLRQISIMSFILSIIILTTNSAAYIFKIKINTITLSMTYLLAVTLFINEILYRHRYKANT